jgi:hypothetical protein
MNSMPVAAPMAPPAPATPSFMNRVGSAVNKVKAGVGKVANLHSKLGNLQSKVKSEAAWYAIKNPIKTARAVAAGPAGIAQLAVQEAAQHAKNKVIGGKTRRNRRNRRTNRRNRRNSRR